MRAQNHIIQSLHGKKFVVQNKKWSLRQSLQPFEPDLYAEIIINNHKAVVGFSTKFTEDFHAMIQPWKIQQVPQKLRQDIIAYTLENLLKNLMPNLQGITVGRVLSFKETQALKTMLHANKTSSSLRFPIDILSSNSATPSAHDGATDQNLKHTDSLCLLYNRQFVDYISHTFLTEDDTRPYPPACAIRLSLIAAKTSTSLQQARHLSVGDILLTNQQKDEGLALTIAWQGQSLHAELRKEKVKVSAKPAPMQVFPMAKAQSAPQESVAQESVASSAIHHE